MPISQGYACSAQYSMRKDLRHPPRLPASSGSSEQPWICAPGLPPASSMSVGAMSWQMTISFTRVPGLMRAG
ncbi:hypothetical protein D3C83_181450 [compost metagenome]